MIITRELIKEDLDSVQNLQQTGIDSFCLLQSAFGYSLTERIVQSEKQQNLHKEFVVCKEDTILGFFRIKERNEISQTSEIQLKISNNSNHPTVISEELTYMLDQVTKFENVTRYYCFLFDHEKDEQNILQQCNFELEGSYDEHIYHRGRYLNLLIFGTDRIKINEL